MELDSKPNATAAVWEHFGFKPTVVNHLTWTSQYVAFGVKQ